ncbi:unnamed protein product [Pleuronectes platessa]|uniref:Uncharacterized protein n=1 Tax=Pleuronectes platessa TaxID=8262 RepID=A0A9N7UG34_PLEPL|nr:unnamed protein product [Pleuronectes platessa]
MRSWDAETFGEEDLVADKTSVSVSVSIVLSTPVFLLALCHFHIGEEGNKKKEKVFRSFPRISPNLFRLSFPPHSPPSAPVVYPPQPGPMELLSPLPAKSPQCGCSQRTMGVVSRPRPETSRWLSL